MTIDPADRRRQCGPVRFSDLRFLEPIDHRRRREANQDGADRQRIHRKRAANSQKEKGVAQEPLVKAPVARCRSWNPGSAALTDAHSDEDWRVLPLMPSQNWRRPASGHPAHKKQVQDAEARLRKINRNTYAMQRR